MLGNWTETISRRLVQWGRRPLKFGSLALLPIILVALAACSNNADADPTPAPTTAPEPQAATIVEIAVGDGRFETLVAALQAADLVETLEGPGPFTVFAPTDEAFAKLPEGTVETLLGDIPTP